MIAKFNSTLAAGIAIAALTAPMAAQGADVKIGFLGGFTGPIESLVPPIFDTSSMVVDQINAAGGILGGQKLVLVKADTTCADATAAANAADRLVNSENVIGAIGPLCSGATLSAANNAGIPGGMVIISPSATSPAITTLEDNDLLFRTTPSDAYQGAMLAKLIKSKGIDNVAVAYVNNDYGKGFADAFSNAYTEMGGKVAAKEAHEDGKADYRAELGSLASSGAENLVLLAYAEGSGQTIIRQALESGDFAKFIGGEGMISDKFLAAVDAKALEGTFLTKPSTPGIPGTAKFNAIAEAAGIDTKAIFVAQVYDATFLLALAIEKNGKAERSGLSAALRSVATAPGEVIFPGEWKKAVELIKAGKDINYEGAAGSHEFDEAGDVPGVIIEVVIKDGKYVELDEVK